MDQAHRWRRQYWWYRGSLFLGRGLQRNWVPSHTLVWAHTFLSNIVWNHPCKNHPSSRRHHRSKALEARSKSKFPKQHRQELHLRHQFRWLSIIRCIHLSLARWSSWLRVYWYSKNWIQSNCLVPRRIPQMRFGNWRLLAMLEVGWGNWLGMGSLPWPCHQGCPTPSH